MEYHNSAGERLSVPTDFSAPIASRNIQKNLMPPSHFSSTAQPLGMHRAVQNQATIPVSWAATPTVPVLSNPTNPWLTVTGRGGVLELHKENQRIVMLQADAVKGKTSSDPSARFLDRSEPWSRLESECHLKVETHNAEAERLEGQVEALKNAAERNRKEMRDKEIALNRHSHSMEEMRSELSRALAELSHVKVALHQNIGEKHRIGSQLNRLERESGEEIARLKQDLELSSEAAHDLADKAEVERRQLEEEVKQQTVTLTLTRREHETELQQLTATHQAALAVAQHANSELHDRHHSMTSKLLRIERSLNEVSNERDLLRNRLSQMGQAFETQSATLQSLRNYIGQLSPKRGEEERLAETVESLNKEKEALQMTAELLTVRLTSVNEILNLQEKKMVAENLSDPLLQHGSKGLQVLRLWREKVYKLCVQLCSKDIELKAQKDELISEVRSMEQQVKREQYQASVLKHDLENRLAELDLERVSKVTLKEDLSKALRENSQVKSRSQTTKAELASVKEAVQRLSLAFEARLAEITEAQAQLDMFSQRLTFANRKVETIQGLIMRRGALQKVQQASKFTAQNDERIRKLQAELILVCEERDQLRQELKRTPELIEKALANLREQFEGKLRQQQQELEESWAEVRKAAVSGEEAQEKLQRAQSQLEESKLTLGELHSQLLRQQEESTQTLREGVSEVEARCSEQLQEMDAQVNSAKREQSEAVMRLRLFERQIASEGEQTGVAQLQIKHKNKELQDLQELLKVTEEDKRLLLATVHERGLLNEYDRVYGAVHTERFQSLKEELKGLGGSSQGSTEEEEKDNAVRTH